jgi:Zn ribbon nucleic-acid-binding protein
MADAIQTVQWSLGAVGARRGDLWLPEGRESLEDVFWASIRRLGLEPRMQSAFQVTTPLWYGLWIDSPLSAEQCALLRDVFTEAARAVPGYREHLEEFTRALADSAETGEQMHVALSPPGHVDFGWITTFVHCPRCKAEGPVERWQEAYPDDPLECPVCGHSYIPSATYSSERELFAETVACPSCGAVHRVRDFSDNEIQILEDHHTYEASKEELGWLRRVEAFYRRHPDMEGRIKPHFLSILQSDDPDVREAMFAGTPFDEITLPPGAEPQLDPSMAWSAEDLEVIEYLERHAFSLEARMRSVEESIESLGSQFLEASPVKCAGCGARLA